MTLRVVRLGTGRDYCDAWLPELSRSANLSVGCYCADESRRHRSVLRELLAEKGAKLA